MNLTEKCLNDIKDFISNTKLKTDSKEFYFELFNVIKNNVLYLYNIQIIETDEKEAALFSCDDKMIYFNAPLVYKFALEKAKTMSKDNYEKLAYYVCVYVILHEIVHVYQCGCAVYGYSKYNAINELYNEFYNMNTFNPITSLLYKYNGHNFCIERNANLVALDNLTYLVPDEILANIKENYMYNYFTGYEKNNRNPVKNSLRMLFKKDYIHASDIPIDLRLLHGFSLTNEEYKEYILNPNLTLSDEGFDYLRKKLERK